jgi:hypothetical protein
MAQSSLSDHGPDDCVCDELTIADISCFACFEGGE